MAWFARMAEAEAMFGHLDGWRNMDIDMHSVVNGSRRVVRTEQAVILYAQTGLGRHRFLTA